MIMTVIPYGGGMVILIYLAVWIFLSFDDGRETRKAARKARHDAFEREQAAKVAADFARHKADMQRVAGWFKRR